MNDPKPIEALLYSVQCPRHDCEATRAEFLALRWWQQVAYLHFPEKARMIEWYANSDEGREITRKAIENDNRPVPSPGTGLPETVSGSRNG